MSTSDRAYQASQELGRVYDAITDSKVLIDFFLSTLTQLIPSRAGYLFLSGKNQGLWLEASTADSLAPSAELTQIAHQTLEAGKPVAVERRLLLPVIVRNSAMGIACLERSMDLPAYDPKDIELGFDLASQFSGALKNILLFEENLRMERLAAVGQAMGMVLHEVKNILQLAKFSDEMIRMGLKDKNEKFLEKGLAKMKKTLKEMDGITWEMTSLTKNYELEPEGIDLSALLEELRDDLAEKAAGYHIDLDFQTASDFPTVEGDGRSLYRALLNLVKNSFEAFQNKPGACVKIRAQIKDDASYELIVEDNGSGMNDEVQARLFEAFFSTKGKRGTGLGLLVVARTVKMHHGEVRVESKLGEGTKFILTLPRKFPKI